MMKIVSIITGIGYGHTIREAAILEELEKKGAEIIIASYGNALEYFKNVYKTLEIDGPVFPEKDSKFSSIKTILMNLKLPYFYAKNYFKLKRLFKAFNPDAIITDFEPLPLYLERNRPHFLIFNFNPFQYKEYKKQRRKRFWAQAKYISLIYKKARRVSAQVIIPTLEKHETKKFHFINPIVRKLPKQSHKELMEKLNLKKPPILIMFGGSHFSTDLLYKMQEVLPKIDEDFIIFTYKISGESHKNITFLPFKENFLEYLKASKGIITQAGHVTLSECVALKKPMLMFPIPNFIEQELNAHFARKNNIAIIESKKNFTENQLLSIINRFVDSIPELEKNFEKLDIETNGAEQAAELIENSIKEKSKSIKQEVDKQNISQAV